MNRPSHTDRKHAGLDLRQALQPIVQPRLEEDAHDAVDGYAEMLLSAAEKARNNDEQSHFFGLSSIVRRKRDAVVTVFVNAVLDQLGSLKALKLSGPATGDGELSIVDEATLEVWLAQSEVSSTAEGRNARGLFGLDSRLTEVAGERLKHTANPLRPIVLVEHFVRALDEPPGETVAMAIRSFSSNVLEPIESLYREVNRRLAELDVLPDLTFKTKPHRVADPPKKRKVETTEPVQPAVANPEAALALEQIINPDLPEAASNRLGTEIVEAALDQVQRQLKLSPQRMGQALMHWLGRHGTAATAAEMRSMQLSDRLMDAMTDDQIISQLSREWLEKMERPLLKLMLEDHSVLTEDSHPARRLINALAQVPDSEQERLTKAEKDINAMATKILDRVVDDDKLDLDGVAEASVEIEAALNRFRRLCEAQTRRVRDACDGQERLRRARSEVDGTLDQRFAGQRVPHALVDLLDAGMRQLMTVARLRRQGDAPNHEEEDLLQLVEKLGQRLQPDQQLEPEKRDAHEDEDLLAQVRHRLDAAGASATQRDRVIDELNRLLGGEGNDQDFIHWPSTEEEEPQTPEDVDPTALGQVKTLAPGSWILLPVENGRPQPLKLAWLADDASRYVFVDRAGHKALDTTAVDLARRMTIKDASIASHKDMPLMDRSWQSLIQRMHDQIAHQATHDELTGLLNRSEFERRIRLHASAAKLTGNPHAALIINLDQFRVANATVGHEAGDQILRDIGALIQDQLPPGSEIARLAGDEFAAIIPDADTAVAQTCAENVRSAIAKHETGWFDRRIRITASIGVNTIEPATEGSQQVLTQLETARDLAREEGGGCIKSYAEHGAQLSSRNLAVRQVADLEAALESGRLVLLGHLIVPVNGSPEDETHIEVLSRIRNPDGTLKSPSSFVPAAEAFGRVHFLDEAVIEKSFGLLRAAQSPKAVLAINISARTFGRPGFIDFVRNRIKNYGIEARQVCMEITETTAISDLSHCADVLRELRGDGCRFSIDDFGTGLASFNYLKHMPVDFLKIDGSFVGEMVRSPEDLGLVRTINEIGHVLGKKTIAEFAHDDATVKALNEVGVDYIQGYALHHPEPLEALLGLDPA